MIVDDTALLKNVLADVLDGMEEDRRMEVLMGMVVATIGYDAVEPLALLAGMTMSQPGQKAYLAATQFVRECNDEAARRRRTIRESN